MVKHEHHHFHHHKVAGGNDYNRNNNYNSDSAISFGYRNGILGRTQGPIAEEETVEETNNVKRNIFGEPEKKESPTVSNSGIGSVEIVPIETVREPVTTDKKEKVRFPSARSLDRKKRSADGHDEHEQQQQPQEPAQEQIQPVGKDSRPSYTVPNETFQCLSYSSYMAHSVCTCARIYSGIREFNVSTIV